MCKHVLNAQVSIRAPCCQRFYDCPDCHAETQTHQLAKTIEMVFICKKCKKAFRKDLTVFEDSDEYCPHCDNHFVIEAKTPAPMLGIEGDDLRMDSRMIKDERVKYDPRRDFYGQEALNLRADERVDHGGVQAALQARMDAQNPNGDGSGDANLQDMLRRAETGGVGGGDDDLDWSY